MEDDTWSFAFLASSRSYQSTLKSQSDLCIDFEEIEKDDEWKTEYPCPYCSEDFDLLGLYCHIDEEHHLEAGYGVCPVCALRVGTNMVDHITTQHGNIFKTEEKQRDLCLLVIQFIPGCKAEAVLQLAATPVSFPQETLADQRTAPWSITCHLQAVGVQISPCSPMVILPSL